MARIPGLNWARSKKNRLPYSSARKFSSGEFRTQNVPSPCKPLAQSESQLKALSLALCKETSPSFLRIEDFGSSHQPRRQTAQNRGRCRLFASLLSVQIVLQPGVAVRRDRLVHRTVSRAQALRRFPDVWNSVVQRFRACRKIRNRVILPVSGWGGVAATLWVSPRVSHSVRPEPAVTTVLILLDDAGVGGIAGGYP